MLLAAGKAPCRPLPPTLALARCCTDIGKPGPISRPNPKIPGDRIRFNGHVEVGVRIGGKRFSRACAFSERTDTGQNPVGAGEGTTCASADILADEAVHRLRRLPLPATPGFRRTPRASHRLGRPPRPWQPDRSTISAPGPFGGRARTPTSALPRCSPGDGPDRRRLPARRRSSSPCPGPLAEDTPARGRPATTPRAGAGAGRSPFPLSPPGKKPTVNSASWTSLAAGSIPANRGVSWHDAGQAGPSGLGRKA